MAGTYNLLFVSYQNNIDKEKTLDLLKNDFDIDPSILDSDDKIIAKELPQKNADKLLKDLTTLGLNCRLDVVISMSFELEDVVKEVESEEIIGKANFNSPNNDDDPPEKAEPIAENKQENAEALPDIGLVAEPKALPVENEALPSISDEPINAPPIPDKTNNEPPSLPKDLSQAEEIILETPVYEPMKKTPSREDDVAAAISNYTGKPAETTNNNEYTHDVTPPIRAKASTEKSKKPIVLIVASVFCLTLGAIGYYLFGIKSEDQSSIKTNSPTTSKANVAIKKELLDYNTTAKKHIAQGNLSDALNAIKEIQSSTQKDALYAKVANLQIKEDDLGQATYTIKKMSNATPKYKLLHMLAVNSAKEQSFNEAKKLAKGIQSYTMRSKTLSEIAILRTQAYSQASLKASKNKNKTETKNNYDNAINNAQNITELDSRIRAFSIIAIDQAHAKNNNNITEAITFIEKVTHRTKVMVEIAAIFAKNDNKTLAKKWFKKAVSSANRIPDMSQRRKTIEDIKKSRADAGVIPER